MQLHVDIQEADFLVSPMLPLLQDGQNGVDADGGGDGGFIEADAQSKTHTGGGPEAGSGGQTADLIAFGYHEELDSKQVADNLASFKGVKRRFSEKEISGTVIIDDYAHHPAEITATIDAARQKYPDREVVAVFQPHTFSRTVALLSEFAESLDLADTVYVCEIFTSAREQEGEVTIEDLHAKIKNAEEILNIDDVSPLLAHQGDVVIFMGAGDIQKYEQAFQKILMDQEKTTH